MHENQTEMLLDLATPRTIALEDRGHTFVLRCRRLTDADWIAFFSGATVTSENVDGKRVDVIDTDTPFIQLAERVLIDAAGYAVVGGGKLTELPEWQSRVPLGHRRQVGYVLASTRPSAAPTNDFVIYPEGEVVSLDATWSMAVEGEGPTMLNFSGLKHVLRTPTEAQYRRFASENSRRVIVGGSRSGKTIYPGSRVALANLYDELVISVDGYCVNGEKLTTPERIKAEMDMHHKVMAAQEVFLPQSAVRLAGGTEG